MTRRDETAAQRVPRPSRPARIQPPPRPGRRPPAGQDPLVLPDATGEHHGRGLPWLTVALFAVLAVAALAVFFVLPEWVEARRDLAPPPGTIPAPALAADPGPGRPAAREPAREPAPAAATADEESDPELTVERGPRPAPKPIAAAPVQTSAPTSDATPAPPPGDAFAQAMSEGLAALDRQDYPAARDAFARAAALRPGSPQSADGLARAETALRLAEITRLRDEAVAFEAGEAWRAAAVRYEAVLALDSTVGFAQRGLARSRARAELSERLDFHATNPHRLSSDLVLQEAAAILAQARDTVPVGPKLARQIAALAAQVDAFSTPVRAVLESDGLTAVVVYRVGRLGAFRRRELDLRPGTYTVVGSRSGYRDVRRQLVIAPGVAPEPLRVRCEEAI